MEKSELPKIRVWSRNEMEKRIAIFSNLKGSKKGLPDSFLPECTRELINVIGFEPPKGNSIFISVSGFKNAKKWGWSVGEEKAAYGTNTVPPPTIPLAPSIPTSISATCIEPPFPLHRPSARPYNSFIIPLTSHPFAMQWPWPLWVDVI